MTGSLDVQKATLHTAYQGWADGLAGAWSSVVSVRPSSERLQGLQGSEDPTCLNPFRILGTQRGLVMCEDASHREAGT